MKCVVGVHTGSIHVIVTEEVYAQMKREMPPRVGFRAWDITVLKRELLFRRTAFTGVTPAKRKGLVRFHFQAEPIVRCREHEREIEVTSLSSFRIAMPPPHEWPWMARNPTTTSAEVRRWHLVQELNARARSAHEHGVDMPEDWPAWVSRMLTEQDRLDLLSGELIS